MGRAYKGYDTQTAFELFTAGKKAEVAFDDEDPREVWFPATVLRRCSNGTFRVEYQQPGSGDEAALHKATVDFKHIRPSPHHLSYMDFGLDDKVDAYYDYGWWSGVITKELADNKYNVFFKHSKKERAFICSKVRRHVEWKHGEWYNEGCNIVSSFQRTAFCMYAAGKKAEVAFDDEDPHEVWFPATVLNHFHRNTCQVEYQQPGSGDEAVLHKATVDFWHIRPSPPHLRDKDFGLDDEVDAYYDFGWWCGVITKELPDNRYSVFFEHSNKEREFICSKLRPHLKWVHFSCKWYNKGDTIFQEEGKAANENTSSHLDEGAKDVSGKTKTQQSVEKDATKDLAGLQCNEMTVSQEKIINKSSTEIVPSVAEGDTEQLDAPSEQLTVVDKEVHEENASTVAPKRKRGRPPKLQAKSPETPLTDNHRNKGVDPSAVSLVESAQMKEDGSPTSSGAKSLEKDQEPLKQDKLHNESQEQDLKAKRSRKKYSFGRGKRGKRLTISINTESPVQDSQDASKEKADENMGTRKTDASVGKLLDTVSDDQPLSRWIDGMHSPIPIQNPASERRPEAVTCGMNAENLPFVKRTPLWHSIESMEAFQKIPQNPHFRPLLGVKESAREGMAIGTMVTFSTVVGRTYCLRVDGPRSAIEDCLETLVELESNGFDVQVIRDRLTRLLLLKDKQQELADRSKGVVEKIEEQKIQEKTIDDEVDEIDRQIRQLEEERRKVLQKKEKWTLENDAMKAAEEAIEQELREVAAKFDGLAAAPL